MPSSIFSVVTITLNPAIDRTVTIRNFTTGKVNRVEELRSNPGGKGVNVASALVDYGHTVAAAGFLGVENAQLFTDFLEQKGIGDHFVRIPGYTRVSIKVADPVLRQTTDINFPGIGPNAGNLDSLWRQIEQLAALDQSWFVIAGSLPPGVDPGIYGRIVSMLRERGQKVVVDTSGESLRHALDAVPHIIKPNIHELEALLGSKLESTGAIVDSAQRFITSGVELVVVSMGEEGALFVEKDQAVFARPPSVKVRSTVGAGDAMVAGVVAAKLGELPLADCARLATAFSLDALVRGVSGITSRHGIHAMMDEVTIDEIGASRS